jgi:hypothetical protein
MNVVKRALPVVLLLAFVAQSYFASRLKSPTFDEPAHVAAGLSYLSRGVFHANLQHPPLIKELSALGLLAGGVRWPYSQAADDLIANPAGKPGRDWDVGNEIIAAGGPDRVMRWARLPMILVALLLGIAIYAWGRRILGETAALGALFLFALDPTLVAHSFLVTTDVGMAAFTVLFSGALWWYVEQPGRGRLIACGVALGCALGSKYSGVFLLPVGATLLLAADRRKTPPVERLRAFALMCLVALAVIEILYLFRATPFTYLEGLRRVNADHDPNYQVFFDGELRRRFTAYFAAAYLLKEPLAAILLGGIGAIVILRKKALRTIDRLFLLTPPLALFAAYSLWADNLGIRYIIPVLPFAWLAGGAALQWLVGQRSWWTRGVAAALCGWMIVAAAGIYPDHLSYFNEAACVLDTPRFLGADGGSRCGAAWLDDSNVDWGQGVKQLKQWLDEHAAGRPVHLLYWGTFPPENYGIHATEAPATPGGRPELYVMSAHYVARVGVTDPHVRNATPIAIVGHALWVYEF